MSGESEPEVIHVEAEPMGEEEARSDGREGAQGSGFFTGPLGPMLGGLLIDLADLATPLGMGKLGLLVGGLVGWWIGSALKLSPGKRLALAALGAVYCSLPGTRKLPLGTLAGAFVRVRSAMN